MSLVPPIQIVAPIILLKTQGTMKLDDTNEERIFEAIISGEVVDYQNELVDIDGLLKAVEVWFAIGAPIMDRHSNWKCGEGLEHKVIEYKGSRAIWIRAKIYDFSNFDPDDPNIRENDHRVWEDIQNGHLAMMSIGGEARVVVQECDEFECHNKVMELDLHEVSTVEEGANQLADIIAKIMDKAKRISKRLSRPSIILKKKSIHILKVIK